MPRVLSPHMQKMPLAPKTKPVFYWCDLVGSWWPRLSRRHLGCNQGRGYLDKTPPIGSEPGAIVCLNCSRELAEVLAGPTRRGRPRKEVRR